MSSPIASTSTPAGCTPFRHQTRCRSALTCWARCRRPRGCRRRPRAWPGQKTGGLEGGVMWVGSSTASGSVFSWVTAIHLQLLASSICSAAPSPKRTNVVRRSAAHEHGPTHRQAVARARAEARRHHQACSGGIRRVAGQFGDGQVRRTGSLPAVRWRWQRPKKRKTNPRLPHPRTQGDGLVVVVPRVPASTRVQQGAAAAWRLGSQQDSPCTARCHPSAEAAAAARRTWHLPQAALAVLQYGLHKRRLSLAQRPGGAPSGRRRAKARAGRGARSHRDLGKVQQALQHGPAWTSRQRCGRRWMASGVARRGRHSGSATGPTTMPHARHAHRMFHSPAPSSMRCPSAQRRSTTCAAECSCSCAGRGAGGQACRGAVRWRAREGELKLIFTRISGHGCPDPFVYSHAPQAPLFPLPPPPVALLLQLPRRPQRCPRRRHRRRPPQPPTRLLQWSPLPWATWAQPPALRR